MMKLSWRILRPILLLIICILAGLFIYDRFFRQTPKPEVTTEELQMKVTQRLRLITEEITYRQDINLYEAGQHAVGTADLVAYVKYDLEKLHLTTAGDTVYVSLPAPEIEIGRRPGGYHSVQTVWRYVASMSASCTMLSRKYAPVSATCLRHGRGPRSNCNACFPP